MITFVLIHSPLVGPMTWQPVAEILRQKGSEVFCPELTSPAHSETAYWRYHATQIAESLKSVPKAQQVFLAAHSGAGMLLPAARQLIRQPVMGYIFVDAGIPEPDKSRLDLFEDQAQKEAFRKAAVNGLLPSWKDEDLREAIPDDRLRKRFITELKPLPLVVYEEPIPVFGGWPDAPCVLIRFGANPAYDRSAQRARLEGWATIQLDGQHFHMLVDPVSVAETFLELSEHLRIGFDRPGHS
jgi:hypothetical protein